MATKGLLCGVVLAVYLLFLLIPVLTLLSNKETLSFQGEKVTYTFLRISGLFGFILLFLQIMHGAFMSYWTRLFGDRAVIWHEKMGLVVYSLILLHPTFFTLSSWVTRGLGGALLSLVPFFSDIYEYYLSLGKIAFSLLTLGVFVAYFRHKAFLNRHWLKFHVLNYVAFWLIFVHSFNIGSDTHTFPMSWFYPISAGGVAASLIWRIGPCLARRFGWS